MRPGLRLVVAASEEHTTSDKETERAVLIAQWRYHGNHADAECGREPVDGGAKVTEKFSRPDFRHLKIEITVDDPKAYTAPRTIVTLNQPIVVDTELLDYVCLENERDSAHFVGK
jgi:hypothetical protein